MRIEVEDVQTISRPAQGYVGWPTVTRCSDGRLLAVCSGGRQKHVCPFGQVHYLESRDDGDNWTWARVLVDGAIDDRDAGVLQTQRGTLLVNWFTSLAWEDFLDNRPEHNAKLTAEQLAEWHRRKAGLTDAIRQSETGCWVIRSTDGGVTWSLKINTVAYSPHGPLLLRDGRLLYPGRRRAATPPGLGGSPANDEIGVSVSEDDGLTWRWLSNFAPMPGHRTGDYHEPHGVEAADGRIIVHIRNQNELHKLDVLQVESSDGGETWSAPRSLGFYGLPAHLLRLRDGRLMTTTGHRREPRGNRVAISEDHGRTWLPPLHLNTDSVGDLGYPSTVQLDDNRFLTIWYDGIEGAVMTQLRQSRWRLV